MTYTRKDHADGRGCVWINKEFDLRPPHLGPYQLDVCRETPTHRLVEVSFYRPNGWVKHRVLLSNADFYMYEKSSWEKFDPAAHNHATEGCPIQYTETRAGITFKISPEAYIKHGQSITSPVKITDDCLAAPMAPACAPS